ncbi:MAG: GNAT family N-acetyltransferase [Deltaproteobacteria bacterium]|nr:GNAT family N-acetyltransferase [Deltaproteobacteria bacterium]
MRVMIRKARADDAPFLAAVMLMASRSQLSYGLWDHFVNGTEAQCLSFLQRLAATKMRHLFHHDVFLIAEKDGRAAAGLSGYDPVTEGMVRFVQALPEALEGLGWSRSDFQAAARRMSSYERCTPEEIPGVWVVESVAAMPEARKEGLVSLLLGEILARGKAKGYGKAQIGIFTGNAAARRVYEKAGFQYVDEKRDPEFEVTYGDYGIARLMMDLHEGR